MYLKQDRWQELKTATDYFIQRQQQNGKWKPSAKGSAIYDEFASEISRRFAQFTAQLDIDYVFAWLDWDGDNVLADAGIIDYGSVRQFGARHDQYRYDDVERFSTNLNEQRIKARLLVQVFVQIADYLKTKKKKPLKDFQKHPVVENFNRLFQQYRSERLLYRMGFNQSQRNLIAKEKGLVESFEREFSYFERAKISGQVQKVADGVNHPALFNMRSILRALPEFLINQQNSEKLMPEEQFFKCMLTHFAKSQDARLRPKHRGHIQNFQRLYLKMLEVASHGKKSSQILPAIHQRALQLNREDRITGNALIQIVDEIMNATKKEIAVNDIQQIIDQLINTFLGMPEVQLSRHYQQKPKPLVRANLFSRLLFLVEKHCHDI